MQRISKSRSFLSALMIGTLIAPSLGIAATIPNNKVDVSVNGFVLSGAYSLVSGQPTGAGEFKNGNVGAYPENSCVLVLAEITNSDTKAGDISTTLVYDYKKNGNVTDAIGVDRLETITTSLSGNPRLTADNLNDFTFANEEVTATASLNSSAGTVTASISGPYSGDNSGTTATSSSDTIRHYNVTLTDVAAGAIVYLPFCGQLGPDASEFPGASMSIGAGKGGGGVPIDSAELLQLPSLTVTKVVSGGTATPDQWSFSISPALNGTTTLTIPSEQSSVTIEDVQTDGTYTVTEKSGPSGYAFSAGSGTNCTFNGSTASASVVAAKNPTNASCSFTNTVVTQPKLTVIKVVVNDNGGTKSISDFPLFVGTSSVTSGVQQEFAPGTYSITETADQSYAASFSGDCNASGTIVLALNDVKTCTITNDDILPPFVATTGTLTVIKTVVNDNGGTKNPSNFAIHVTGTNPSLTSFPGSTSGTVITLEAGAYAVTEDSVSGYAGTASSSCSGTIVVGQNIVCTITNDDIATGSEGGGGGGGGGGGSGYIATTGTVVIMTHVVNNNGGSRTASDFTMVLNATNPSQNNFLGSESGVAITVDAGGYIVSEGNAGGYVNSYSTDCVGTIAAGETKTCTVTNDDPGSSNTGGGGGGGGGGGVVVVVVSSAPSSAPAPAVVPTTLPTPRVLGEEDVNVAAGACVLTESEAAVITADVRDILRHLGKTRDEAMEAYFNTHLVPRIIPADLQKDLRVMVENYTNYGTKMSARLGQGERAGVVDSYRAVYGTIPSSDCDWQNAVRIATTQLPTKRIVQREKESEKTFKKVYGRAPNAQSLADTNAVHIISYGLRPAIRDLAAERTALTVYKRIYSRFPQNASEWDTNRAIAYSGVEHSLLASIPKPRLATR